MAPKKRRCADARDSQTSPAIVLASSRALGPTHLCSGCAGYALEQLKLTCTPSAPRATALERDSEGEDHLLLRHSRIVDMLSVRGWAQVHRSGGGLLALEDDDYWGGSTSSTIGAAP